METVLVAGATGNIGVSAVKAALRSKRNVLAIVRNQVSANKLVKHIGSSEGITFAEASVISDTGVKSVVDQVRAGKLPAFQHVFTCGWCSMDNSHIRQVVELTASSVGGEYVSIPLQEITTERLRKNMTAGFESNFCKFSWLLSTDCSFS